MHTNKAIGVGLGSNRAMALLLGAGLVGVFANPAMSQQASTTAQPAAAPVVRSTGDARRDTMMLMMKQVTIEFKEQRLEEIMTFLAAVTGADMEFLWLDDRNSSGLDKDKTITLKFAGGSALALLEKVLEKASDDLAGGSSTWQMSESGTLQVGPRERLNLWKKTKIYPVSDLLTEVPNFTNAPEFDLQQALQTRRGGGGGQPPFRQNQANDQQNQRPLADRMDELKRLITELVEREQWVDNGGSGATIQYFQGTFLVNAPDYIHRGLDGYAWWPSEGTAMSTTNGRRYVSLSLDSAIATTDHIRKQPVTATTGGGPGAGGGGGAPGGGGAGGGGGSTTPVSPPKPK
jgi:hypothetical protein